MAGSYTMPLFPVAPVARIRDASPVVLPPKVERAPSSRKPRYYQAAAANAAIRDLREVRSTFAIMPTGTGKTFLGSLIARAGKGRVLWLNERDNLVKQMRGELSDHMGVEWYLEQAGIKAPDHARFVVGSLQSMCQDNRLAGFPPDWFSLIITDECHHHGASYRKIYGHFPKAKLFGLTATPPDPTQQSLAVVYERCCYKYERAQAVKDGYIVPVRIKYGESIDLSKLKKRKGDFTDDELAELLAPGVLRGIVDETLEHARGQRGIIYVPRVDTAHLLAAGLNAQLPGCAQAVDGRDMERDMKRGIIAAHKRGEFLYLVNDSVVTEGHDDPNLSFIGQARPTKSLSRYIQEIGRPIRPGILVDQYPTAFERRQAIAASWKPFAMILDFVGNAGKHNLASAVDAMAGHLDDAETRERAKKVLKENGGDVEGALEEARKSKAQERANEEARIARVEGARWNWKSIDPFTAYGMEGPSDVADALHQASPKQRAKLRMMGMDVPPILRHDDAQRLIKAEFARKMRGLADFASCQFLAKHGISGKQMYQRTADQLRRQIAANGGVYTPAVEAEIK